MATRPVNALIGDGTAAHASRGVGAAQDYPCPIGTPVVAPFAAVRIVRWGDDDALGGFALTGYAANGDYWVVQHLCAYLDHGSASEGEAVALSGNTGRWTDGPHVHHYLVVGGVRCNPEDIGLYNHPEPAPYLLEENTMALIIRRQSDGIIGLVAPQLWAHMPDEETAVINAQVNSITDEIHDLDDAGFDRVTRSLGIPDDQRVPGRFWSVQNDLRALLTDLRTKLGK